MGRLIFGFSPVTGESTKNRHVGTTANSQQESSNSQVAAAATAQRLCRFYIRGYLFDFASFDGAQDLRQDLRQGKPWTKAVAVAVVVHLVIGSFLLAVGC